MMIRLHRHAAEESISLVLCELGERSIYRLETLNRGCAIEHYQTLDEAIEAVKG